MQVLSKTGRLHPLDTMTSSYTLCGQEYQVKALQQQFSCMQRLYTGVANHALQDQPLLEVTDIQ